MITWSSRLDLRQTESPVSWWRSGRSDGMPNRRGPLPRPPKTSTLVNNAPRSGGRIGRRPDPCQGRALGRPRRKPRARVKSSTATWNYAGMDQRTNWSCEGHSGAFRPGRDIRPSKLPATKLPFAGYATLTADFEFFGLQTFSSRGG
jgi:hypothetical protein